MVASPQLVTVVPFPTGVDVKVVMPGIEGIEGGLSSVVVITTLARCLLHETKSCCPVGLYVVPSLLFSVTVAPSAFQP